MGPSLNVYLNKLSAFVEETEKTGEGMNADYEKIRNAIDEKKTDELSSDDLAAIYAVFEKGVDSYLVDQANLKMFRAPARVIGIHKRLEKTFDEYVVGCQKMLAAVDGKLDIAAFDEAENDQDEASKGISFCIARITQLAK